MCSICLPQYQESNHCYPSGENSSYLLMGTLKALADIQKLPDEDLIYRKQVVLSLQYEPYFSLFKLAYTIIPISWYS